MQPTREELIRNIAQARTKETLETSSAQLQEHYATAGEQADPEKLAVAVSKIVCGANAITGASFPLPLSVPLLSSMMRQASSLSGSYLLVGAAAWTKLLADSEFMSLIDPTSKLSSVLAGRVGAMYGLEIYTDAYYLPAMRSLPLNSLTIMAAGGKNGLTVTLA